MGIKELDIITSTVFPACLCDSKTTEYLCLFIQVLPDEHARDMCQRFADMESKLGEIDRARAIYSYCSQICDPRVRLTGNFISFHDAQAFPLDSFIFVIIWRWRLISGKPGKNLKSAMGTRTPFERCWGLNVVSRPPTTPKSTSCPLRCWRPQPAPLVPVRPCWLWTVVKL